jgi:hypothetical protein
MSLPELGRQQDSAQSTTLRIATETITGSLHKLRRNCRIPGSGPPLCFKFVFLDLEGPGGVEKSSPSLTSLASESAF